MKARYWLMAPPVLAAGLMGFGLATWSARVLTPPARESAQVGFLPAELDLGESPWNTTVPFHAVFANGGERPIVIDDVKTSCGYVAIGEEYAGRTLSPGERVTMEGLFDTEYRVGPAVHRLTVTASGEATYELALSCDVKPTYRLNPARMWFTFDDPSAQPVVLISDDGVEFTGAAADKPWLVPSFDGHTLDVDVDWALVPRGRHRATPNVYTTDRYVTGAQLPVTAQRPHTAYLVPDTVYLLNDLHCVIRLCGLGDDDDIEITGLQGLPAGVRAEVNRSELCLSASAGRSGLDTPVYVDLSDGRQVAFMLCY